MNFESIKYAYEMGWLTKDMVRNCVEKGKISADEYKEIVGEKY